MKKIALEAELKKYFHYETFRQGQREIVEGLLNNQNVLGILPTGAGKTLCYALPTLMKGWRTLVISPLISLMEDQVVRLNQIQKNCAIYLNSSQSKPEQEYILAHLSSFHFIVMSPELLQNIEVQRSLKQAGVHLAVVDEAHCISSWGFDFRPEYLQLPAIFKRLQIKNLLGLTATAPKVVREDITRYLFLKANFLEVRFPVNRENIGYVVEEFKEKEDKIPRLLTILKILKGSGIIYCNTRKKCEELTDLMKKQGILCAYYHGGVPPMARKVLQAQFKRNHLQVMVATNAFGMGIDKPDIRFVIHYEFPSSLEDYVQETGRCSRDGKKGLALLFYHPSDRRIHTHFAKQRQEDAEVFYQELEQEVSSRKEYDKKIAGKNESPYIMERFIKSEHCYRESIAAYFGDESPEIPHLCCSNHQLKVEDYAAIFSENNEEAAEKRKTRRNFLEKTPRSFIF